MPAALLSRWGLQPVVVDTKTPSPSSASPASTEVEEEDPDDDSEVTGRTLWDCTQVLWDLVADPDPQNAFAVRGKHVIELGGGTGALSVGLARAGAASVACTDLPCHLARIQRTVHANTRPSSIGDCGGGGHSDEPTAPVAVQGLRWGDEGDLARVRAQRRNIGTARYIRGSGNRNVSCHTGETQSRSGGDGDGAATADLALDVCATSEAAAAAAEDDPYAFDVVVLSEVLYWPALDLLQEDTREPLRRTLLGLSNPGTKVILVYKERWPHREKEFLASCEGSFEVKGIPASLLALPASTNEGAGSSAIRAVVMTRTSLTN